MSISPNAYYVAGRWADSRKHPATRAHREDIAEQAQSHLNHGAEPMYLACLAGWMAVYQPTWFDLSLAMRMSGAPQPEPTAAPGPRMNRQCPCRGSVLAGV